MGKPQGTPKPLWGSNLKRKIGTLAWLCRKKRERYIWVSVLGWTPQNGRFPFWLPFSPKDGTLKKGTHIDSTSIREASMSSQNPRKPSKNLRKASLKDCKFKARLKPASPQLFHFEPHPCLTIEHNLGRQPQPTHHGSGLMGSFQHGCCWDTFYIFAYCGLVVEIQIHSTAKKMT